VNAEEWNAANPVGATVDAAPGALPRDGGAVMRTRTRTPAWTLGSGEAVVSVVGYPGGIALTHVQVVNPPTVADINALLDINLYEVPSFRADVRIDFDEHGHVFAARILNTGLLP